MGYFNGAPVGSNGCSFHYFTTEDIARDILRTSYKLLKRYDDSIEKDDKEKYLQYAPQVFEMCADFQNQF